MGACLRTPVGVARPVNVRRKEGTKQMYIGIGTVVLIIIIILAIMLFRRL
jgi:hypothetical protein